MFARSASTTRRTWTPLRLLVVGLSLVMAATFGPPAAMAGDPGTSGDAPYRGRVIALMQHMTLQQKVGQLFVIEVAGRHATTVSDAAKAVNQRLYGVDTPAQAIAKYQPGGVIYYSTRVACAGCASDDNIGDPAQVATMSNGLQAASLAQPAHIPLQISVDQEGGALVARFLAPATQMPGNMALGAGRSTADAYDSAKVIGQELKAVGVTQDYAPVSDVNINPNNPVIGIRSIGGDANLVSSLASWQVKGYHAGGVSAVAKHFPGHGDTGVDSHFGLPEVTHSLEQFHAIDLPPFKAAIAAGVDTIMTAHVVFPAVDPETPATMSHEILTGVLRDELGFKGLIVTDALDMGGATATYPPNVAPVQAILAGADQLLIPPQMDTAYGAVLDAVRNGTISKKRLDDSVYRVLMHKYQRGIFAHPMVDPAAAPTIMGAPEHLANAQAITDHTTTLVKNDVGLLPLTAGPRNVLVAGWGVGTTQGIANALAARGATTQVEESGLTPTATDINDAVVAAQDKDLVVVSTNNAYAVNATTGQPTPGAVAQTQLVRALLATGKPVVVAAMRNPYDVASFAEAPTVLDTYGYTGHQVESLVRVLFGEVNPTGRLPVSIPRADGTGELFPFGHGLGY